MVVALGTLGFGLWKSAYLLLFSTKYYDVLSFVREATDHLVATVTRIAAFCAGHEDLLFHLGWEKGRPALRAELQNVFNINKATPQI